MDDWRAMSDRIRNWGRWGADDELGTLNLITSDKVAEGAALVTQGKVFALGMDFGDSGPQGDLLFRRNPLHTMTIDGGDGNSLLEHVASAPSNKRWQEGAMMLGGDLLRYNDDMVVMHLQSATQWDALAHVYYEEKMYNGYPSSAVTSFGASKLSIDKVDVKGITSRAVLLDMVKYRGEDMHCAHGEHIMPDELTEAAKQQGVEVGEGDIVVVHTGWTTKFYATGDKSPSAGLSWRCAEWLHERGVAAVAADNSQVEDPVSDLQGNLLPMHLLCLRDMGMQFGEYWKLDDLAADCAADGRYEFQLVAPPLRITGAVGSPINPIALK
ncbi:MAG: cyclase family protein [Aeromicrobium sp.]